MKDKLNEVRKKKIENFDYFLFKNKIKLREIGEIIGSDERSVSQKKIRGTWKLEEVYLLAAHFKCSIEEIFGEVGQD